MLSHRVWPSVLPPQNFSQGKSPSLFFVYPQGLSAHHFDELRMFAIEGKSPCLPAFWHFAKVPKARIAKEQAYSLKQDLNI